MIDRGRGAISRDVPKRLVASCFLRARVARLASRRLEFNGEATMRTGDGQGRNSDCIVSTIQYVRHNRFVDCNQPTEACFQRISQHPLDPRTTFRQITPIPLIEYISIHQRRVSQPCVTFVRYTGENQKQYFSPNRPSAAPERE